MKQIGIKMTPSFQTFATLFVLSVFLVGCGGSSKKEQNQSETSSSSSVDEIAKQAGNTGEKSINVLTESVKKEGWKLLFDGKSLDKWRGAHKEQLPDTGWVIQDGNLMVMEAGGGEAEFGGDIVTKEEYEDFELKLDFKITKGANSGIKYFVTENYPGHGSAIGLEYQILDDKRHPDANKGRNGNRTLASLYDLKPAKNKNPNPIGEWNHARIVAKGNHVEHWLNGEKVLEYDRDTEEFDQLVEKSKYTIHEGFGKWDKGHILLQDHGNKVYYRNIKIRRL